MEKKLKQTRKNIKINTGEKNKEIEPLIYDRTSKNIETD